MIIKAAVVYGKNGPYVLEDIELAEPKANEVLVKIVASGVCHTDHMVITRPLFDIFPLVPGHEGCGIVERVGDLVTDFAPGDSVCMSFSYCNECFACVTGRPYECEENLRLNFGGKNYDGTKRLSKDGIEISNLFNQSSFATYSVTHRNNLVHVPDGIDLRLTGPLGCGIQTGAGAVLNCLKPEPGSSLVVMGCGGVGLSALMAAKCCGCTSIIAVDTVDSRLDLALELGATHTVNAGKTDTVSLVKNITGGKGADYAVNSSGSGATAGAALNCTHNFGRLAIIGSGDFAFGGYFGARLIAGVTEGWSIPRLFIPQLINLYQQGSFPFDRLMSFYNFDEINTASEDSLTGKAIKPVLVME